MTIHFYKIKLCVQGRFEVKSRSFVTYLCLIASSEYGFKWVLRFLLLFEGLYVEITNMTD